MSISPESACRAHRRNDRPGAARAQGVRRAARHSHGGAAFDSFHSPRLVTRRVLRALLGALLLRGLLLRVLAEPPRHPRTHHL